MRKAILLFSFAVILLTALSSFAYSQYKAAIVVDKTAVCNNQIKNGETMFETLVKQFVGAVKY
jgi:hypothetical protein